jgi:superfamily II DNA or RNA helicase
MSYNNSDYSNRFFQISRSEKAICQEGNDHDTITVDLSLTSVLKAEPLIIPNYTMGKTPRYYQEAAIKKTIEAFLQGKRKLLLTMATGTGKTLVAFQIAWKLFKAGSVHKILYIADRVFLRDQAYNVFEPFGDARDIIKEGKSPKNRDIYFATYQSLFSGDEKSRLYEQYKPNFFDLIIIDEAHRSGFGMWNVIFKRFANAIQFGMTATPKRDDNIDTYAYFGEPVYSYSLGQGIEDGFLAPYKIHKIFTNIDKEGILYLRQAQDAGANIYIPAGINPKDYYTLGEFEQKISLPDRTEKICEHLSDLLRDGPTDKTMVFCVNMDHAGQVAKELQNHFSYLKYQDYAVRIVSEEMDVRSLLEKFVDSDSITPVVATTVDRPIVRLMVKILNPQIGETIYDPFCGSGGFLAEAYNYMQKSRELSAEDYTILQTHTFYGQEKKPIPYLIGVMNCILHGLLTIKIRRKNTLTENNRNVSTSEKFDIILTNPPFGGTENRQIQQNFAIQSNSTELLALQYVMKHLNPNGRCGMVVPEGVLFREDSSFAKVKEELIRHYNVYTIISLPPGVFANVTAHGQGPKTNLLFFDKSGPTKEIWYYELLPPNGKNYSKVNLITDEELEDCFEKSKTKPTSENSWTVSAKQIIENNYVMTSNNPNRKQTDLEQASTENIIADVLEKERSIQSILEEMQTIIQERNGEE